MGTIQWMGEEQGTSSMPGDQSMKNNSSGSQKAYEPANADEGGYSVNTNISNGEGPLTSSGKGDIMFVGGDV
jgi:hypothetical protein